MNNLNKVDYKDVETLKKFLTPHARILARKRSNINSKAQRKIAQAIKRARFMALLPYISK